jgi:hypothetical protein
VSTRPRPPSPSSAYARCAWRWRAAARCVASWRACCTTDVDSFLATEAGVVVEAIGGLDPALRIARTAPESGRRLATANKALIATHGPALLRLTRRSCALLDLEAGPRRSHGHVGDRMAHCDGQVHRVRLDGVTLRDVVEAAHQLRDTLHLGDHSARVRPDLRGIVLAAPAAPRRGRRRRSAGCPVRGRHRR